MEWQAIYEVLNERFENGHWWPGDSDLEIMVGAVLTQNTTWTSVEKALAQLRDANCLTETAIADCPRDTLMELIRPAGSYTRKAATLTRLVDWLETVGRDAERMTDADLRSSLLAVNGIGPETADDILLYVYQRPVFIFDTYARRMLTALHMPVHATYEGTRRLHEDSIRRAGLSADTLGRFHGLIVEAGKYARSSGWDDVFRGLHRRRRPHNTSMVCNSERPRHTDMPVKEEPQS